MSRGPRIDWSKVDFRRPVSLIAEELGCSVPAVYAARRKYFDEEGRSRNVQQSLLAYPDEPNPSTVPETSASVSQNSGIDWSKVDFSRPADQIAKELKCNVTDVFVACQQFRGVEMPTSPAASESPASGFSNEFIASSAKKLVRPNKVTAQEPLEKQLWSAADKLRKNIDAAEYKHVVLGLIFLKYISESFESLHALLEEGLVPCNS